ncbi:cation-transporting P-type ATPase [Candidatus Micrarchaeota archaeon]|nr:cation-transporting P-type ATPase [Candidatus Micrarchaeota archaeon]
MDNRVPWHSISPEEVLSRLNTRMHGLTEKEAAERLEQFGKNEIALKKRISLLKIFIDQFNDFLIFILIAAAIISAALGYIEHEEEYLFDSALIVLIVALNGLFGFFQNYKAEKSLEALKKLAVPNAMVIRGGTPMEINSTEIVPGDIIHLNEGDKIPADSRILLSKNLLVDESILTGESVPSSKITKALEVDLTIADRTNMLYKDTYVSSGNGEAVVVNTGLDTEVGLIAKAMHEAQEPPTLFQEELNTLGKNIGTGLIGIILMIALVQFFLSSMDPVTVFLTAIALAVAAIPEGLPAVVTLALALGTMRMVKKNSLVRRLSVIEGLSSVDVICTDKTGTLTENALTVRMLYAGSEEIEVTGRGHSTKGEFLLGGQPAPIEQYRKLLWCGLLCNNVVVGKENGKRTYLGDPTEAALFIAAKKAGVSADKYSKVEEFAFSSDRKRMTTIHTRNGECVACMKGAPEVVLEHCTHILENGKVSKLTNAKIRKILEKNLSMGESALRVLAFSYKELPKAEVSEGEAESGHTFIGLQGMVDPPRSEVPDAIGACKRAGIRVIMITGDNIATAGAIAKEVGIGGAAIEGKDLEKMSDSELRIQVEKAGVFARVSPLDKQRILQALQANGHNVAMTGDGVNDAPALRNSHVGISMGIRGTDIAKQASDMVLLDDNFASIAEAVKEGRTIFSNIRNFVTYLLMSNFSEVFVVFLTSLMGLVPIRATQLLWINLLTDGAPALVLGADPPRAHVMKQKPRPRSEGIINKWVLKAVLSIGIVDTLLIIGLFFYCLPLGAEYARTMVFTGFVLSEASRLIVIRMKDKLSFFSNRWLLVAIIASLALQLLVLYTPISAFFGTVPLGIEAWEVLLGFLVVSIISVLAVYHFFLRDAEHPDV